MGFCVDWIPNSCVKCLALLKFTAGNKSCLLNTESESNTMNDFTSSNWIRSFEREACELNSPTAAEANYVVASRASLTKFPFEDVTAGRIFTDFARLAVETMT